MRGRFASILALGTVLAVSCVAGATAYKPTVIPIGFPPLELNGGFKPTKLSKGKLTPIHFHLSGRVDLPVGWNPPALREVVLETDKNAAINAKGLEICGVRRVELVATPHPCKGARIGEGEMEFEVEFPETHPFAMKSRAVAFNGGVRDGVTTLFIRAYLQEPISAAVVMKVEVSKTHRGRYGYRWLATIPVIAGGSSWVKSFELNLFRRFAYKGKKQSYLLAKCTDGKLQVGWKAKFADDSEYDGSFVRPCTPQG